MTFYCVHSAAKCELLRILYWNSPREKLQSSEQFDLRFILALKSPEKTDHWFACLKLLFGVNSLRTFQQNTICWNNDSFGSVRNFHITRTHVHASNDANVALFHYISLLWKVYVNFVKLLLYIRSNSNISISRLCWKDQLKA